MTIFYFISKNLLKFVPLDFNLLKINVLLCNVAFKKVLFVFKRAVVSLADIFMTLLNCS